MQVAIYARVSTERQEREQTIAGQLVLLRAWAEEHSHTIAEEHMYIDEGYSGSRLDRPALDRLRDAIRDGAIELVAVLSPDRLARKYAYQVLLLEEFKRLGCELVFVQHPISEDPNDQLLLQIQGAMAEYERALLGERFRRGRLQRAQAGCFLANRPPYGYRYVPKQDGCPGHLVVDEEEAEVIRTAYRWLLDEQLSTRQILKRLNEGPIRPRSGRRAWSSSVVYHMLGDPLYAGTAYANRYRYVPAKKPRTPAGRRNPDTICRQPRPREEWIAVPVPAIIDQAAYDRAQEQLDRNATLSFRHNTKHHYLLRCLVRCGVCGLAMFGVGYGATATRPERRYYRCAGKQCLARPPEERCPRQAVLAEELEAAVWTHVRQLLQDPAQLLAQFQRLATEGTAAEHAERAKLQARLDRLTREESRLLDAYQGAVISLAELAERRQQIAIRWQALLDQQAQQERLRREQATAQEVLTNLTAFCARIRGRLADATFEDQQAILQLLIDRIIVGEGTVEVHHVIPLRGPEDGASPPGPSDGGLRSDGMGPTDLPA